MKLILKSAAGAWLIIFGLLIGHGPLWIEANDSDEANAASALDVANGTHAADDSWVEADTPDSQLFPTPPSRDTIGDDWQTAYVVRGGWYVPRLEMRDKTSAFADFHHHFTDEFYREGPIADYSTFFYQRRSPLCDANKFLHQSLARWHIVEWPRGFTIQPKPTFADDEFQAVKVDLLSKCPPALRAPKVRTPMSRESIGRRASDFERSIVTYDDTRMLNACCEYSIKTEWQVARLKLVMLTQSKGSGSNYHRCLDFDEVCQRSSDTLNAFEQRAIDQLETNMSEPVVTNLAEGEIQVVGALRADIRCQECHKTRDNTMLGVFSYQLKRAQPMPSKY